MATLTKADEIIDCLSNQEVDLWKLRGFALTEGGFLNNSLRRRAWPKLLGLNETDNSIASKNILDFKPNASGFPSSVDIEQVDRDVARCSWHLLTLKQRQEWDSDRSAPVDKVLRKKQNTLALLIKHVLQDPGQLHYYQGFHDIAAIFLSVFTNGTKAKQIGKQSKSKVGIALASTLLQRICNFHLRDCMQHDFTSVTAAIQIAIFPMIQFFDTNLHSHLKKSGVEPYFALSWILTWFSHDVRDTKTVARLFDVFLASHPLLPLYLSVAMVLHPTNKHELLQTEIDFSTMHMALQTLPKKSCFVAQKLEESDPTSHVKNGNYSSLNLERAVSSDQVLMKESYPPIPFQDLIDMAISYMHRLPPRKLIPLAKQYQEGKLISYIKESHNIKLLRNPPLWAIASTMSNDIALSKKRSDSQKFASILKSSSISQAAHNNASKKNLDEIYRKYSNALIVSGMGPDASDIKRRKLLILGGIGFVAVALSIGFLWIKWTDKQILIKNSCNMDDTICPIKPDFSIDTKTNNTGQRNGWLQSLYLQTKNSLNTEAEIVFL